MSTAPALTLAVGRRVRAGQIRVDDGKDPDGIRQRVG
jgi:hypothetical protein